MKTNTVYTIYTGIQNTYTQGLSKTLNEIQTGTDKIIGFLNPMDKIVQKFLFLFSLQKKTPIVCNDNNICSFFLEHS